MIRMPLAGGKASPFDGVGLVALTVFTWLVFDNIGTGGIIVLKGNEALISGNLTAIEGWFVVFGSPIATVIVAVLIVIITPLIATTAYFKRKEYETVRQRYLDDGLVKIIQQAEYGLGVFEYNWAHSVHLLKTYRDLGPNCPPEFYKFGFANFDASISFEASRHYLLTDLIGDKVYFDIHQLLIGYLHEADNLFKLDLGSALRLSLEGAEGGTIISAPQEIYESYKEALEKIHKESEPYYVFLGNLQLITSELSRRRYNFKSLKKFKNEPQVIKSIASLKEIFKEDLDKYANNSASNEAEEEH